MWGALFTPKYPKGTRLYPKEDSEEYALVEEVLLEFSGWKYKVRFGGSEEWLTDSELLEKFDTEPNDAHLQRWAKDNGWIYKRSLE